jgi:hypothetical protein
MDKVTSWRKASYSGTNGGNCVEVGNAGRIAVRDSKDPEGPKLGFTPEQWRAFTRRIKHSR